MKEYLRESLSKSVMEISHTIYTQAIKNLVGLQRMQQNQGYKASGFQFPSRKIKIHSLQEGFLQATKSLATVRNFAVIR
jgi:hypothetical protein